MPRLVRLDNISDNEIIFDDVDDGQLTVPAYSRVTLSYERFTRLAVLNDFPAMRIEVDMAQEGFKQASVKDFGAKGDGVTNDTQAIQRAIDFMAEYGGGIVNIPVGVYPIDGITVKSAVVLQGESKTGSVVKMRKDAPAISFIGASGGMDKVCVYNGSNSVYAEDCDDVHISDSLLLDSTPCISAYIGDGSRNTIIMENCTLRSIADTGGYYDTDSDSFIMESFCLYE